MRTDAESVDKITGMFEAYRNPFIAFFSKQFPLEKAEIEDIYQESFIVLYQDIRKGKLDGLSASLKTYLFRVGINKTLNYIRDTKKYVDLSEISDMGESEETEVREKQKEIVRRLVLEMGDPCSKVLGMALWLKKSMEEIARAMNYKTSQVAKNKKHACLKSLKERAVKEMKSEGLI